MVYLNQISFEGLYSFNEKINIDLSNHVIIVGPNNSGKSNLFKILRILIDSFYNRSRLKDSQISIGKHSPFLEANITLSLFETRKIIDFFSFPQDERNDASIYHQFENYEILSQLLNELKITLSWGRAIEGAESEPYVKIEFPKIGLKLFNYIHSGYRISNEFPKNKQERSYSNDIRLVDLLDKITKQENPTETTNKFFYEVNADIGISKLRFNINRDYEENAQKVLRNLFSFLDVTINTGQEINFSEFLGTILHKGIHFSEGSVGKQPSILEIANRLKLSSDSPVLTNEGTTRNFNTVLEEQAHAKVVEFNESLDANGSNLTNYLFSMKNSPKQNDRNKFAKIREGFVNLLATENLDIDVLLQYEFPQGSRPWSRSESAKPQIPTIMILDKNLDQQFSLEQVGAGLYEVIYLLTLAYGTENSIVLLDEPSVNLHPSLMKAISKKLQNPDFKNQFMIITHSPELASYEIFDNKSSILYIRRKNKKSIVKTLTDNTKDWFEQNRHRLKHQIDTRIFFAKSVILTEGDADKNLLDGIANSFELTDPDVNVTNNDVMIIEVGGKDNFKKYIELMKTFEIPYLALGDLDAKNLLGKSGIINKDKIDFEDSVIIIENGNLENLMKEIDLDIYTKALIDNGRSKPAVAYAFADEISSKNPVKLNPIKSLLKKAIELSKV